jgi:hypothetical protein
MTSTFERSTLIPVAVGTASVPRELNRLLLGIGFRERQLVALSARLGLCGEAPATLAVAGKASGYTRERVRQLEAQLRQARGRLPATERALRTIERLAPAPLQQVADELEQLGLLRSSFSIGSLLRAAELLGLEHDVFELGAAVLRRADAAASDQALAVARRLVRRDGVGNVDGLGAQACALLRLRTEPMWLDRRRAWFLIRGTESRAGRLLGKMLSSSRSLTIAEIDAGFRRALRPVVAPPHVVASICAVYPWLVVDRATGTVTRKAALGSAHSPVERAILEIFAAHGPTLRFGEVVEHGVRRGLNRASVGVYLTRMPSVARLRRGVYAVRGAA